MLLGCPGHCGKLLGVLVNVVLGEHHKWVMKVLPSRLCLGGHLATSGDIFGSHDLGDVDGDWECCLLLCMAPDDPTPEKEPTPGTLLCTL